MTRFIEVTSSYGEQKQLVNVDSVHCIYTDDNGRCVFIADDGSELTITMDYDSIKAYLGGMILGA